MVDSRSRLVKRRIVHPFSFSIMLFFMGFGNLMLFVRYARWIILFEFSHLLSRQRCGYFLQVFKPGIYTKVVVSSSGKKYQVFES